MKEFTTPRGKTICMIAEPNAVRIQFKQGGELPEELSGKFTSPYFAEVAILSYLAKQESKAERGKSTE